MASSQVLAVMNELGVNIVLGERLDMTSVKPSDLTKSNEHVVRTLSGKELRADLIVRSHTSNTLA